jgi:hypothetical protein
VVPQQLILERFQPLKLHQQVLLLRYNGLKLLMECCHGIALHSSNRQQQDMEIDLAALLFFDFSGARGQWC